jgi:putative Mn2+ efflux pump MntP
MGIWETLALAVALGMDAFSVALGIGSSGTTLRGSMRLSFHFGLFQFMMPIIGWLLGRNLIGVIRRYDHWAVFLLLAGIGVKMIYEAFKIEREDGTSRDKTRGWTLIALSIATSIDALGAGVGMGILRTNLLIPCAIIGLVAGTMSMAGVRIGHHLSALFGRRMEILGGLVLIGLGFKMLFTV